ncbi:DUF1850 domain-containing protein [Zavarzinia sp.]|uniref:DUF1850 domain-containing protein n=1 Tax=Zavarzinia sp. TaxID=2027920 RepID=UPI00356AF9A6
MSLALCLLLGSQLVQRLEAKDFTLAWRHSIEKIEWQEDWRIEADGLHLIAARVQGSGAGMDPPADAVRRGDWWEYVPALAPQQHLTLARSGLVPDYRLCVAGGCRTLGEIAGLPPEGAVTLTPCE